MDYFEETLTYATASNPDCPLTDQVREFQIEPREVRTSKKS